MIGHCGRLRETQSIGDHVSAHAYLRDDHILDEVLPPEIPIPPIAEVQQALAIAAEQVWKEEGLTIASLALRAAMPETQLRRLINDCLGYRNFPSYVNAHRIAAAKNRLADPNESRVSISTIAYDIGFASLGPFNRAFKEEAGVSPSEWRRKSLDVNSPIPEGV